MAAHIPDLDPRADAHLWGPVTIQRGAVIILGWLVWGLFSLVVLRPLGPWGLVPAVLAGLLGTGWVAFGGPELWQRHRRWLARPRGGARRAGPPGLADFAFRAADPGEPIWVSGGAAWACALIHTTPTALWDPPDRAAWHAALASAIRAAAVHGVLLDVIAAQAPADDPRVAPPPQQAADPAMAERWRFWAEHSRLGAKSLCLVRLGWPTPDRNQAWTHFQAVREAWEAVPVRGGRWLQLPADRAWELVQAAADPGESFVAWRRGILERLAPPRPQAVGVRRAQPGRGPGGL